MFESYRFVTTKRWSSRRTVFALPIHVSISSFRLPSHMNTTSSYINFCTCCSVLPLTCSIHCLGCLERQYLDLFSTDFHSCLVENSLKQIQCMLQVLLTRCEQHQIVREKTVDPAVFNSDNIIDLAVTVYPIHIEQRSPSYGPWAKSGLRRHFVNNEKIIYLWNISWFGRM